MGQRFLSISEQREYLKTMRKWGGLLLIDKPLGITSQHIDTKLRSFLNIKKLGHVGTLDPFASGVLPLCIAQGTSLVPYLENDIKKYRLWLHLACFTDSLDAQGELISLPENSSILDTSSFKGRELLKRIVADGGYRLQMAVDSLKDLQTQYPPLYSAVKYKGRPLYSYARNDEAHLVELKSRPIKIYEARLISFRYVEAGAKSCLNEVLDKAEDLDRSGLKSLKDLVSPSLQTFVSKYPLLEVQIDFTVSKGTYIRSLCESLAQKLGLAAYAAYLVRTACGKYELKDSLSFEFVSNLCHDRGLEELRRYLLPIERVLDFFPRLKLADKESAALSYGQKLLWANLDLSEEYQEGRIFRLYYANRFLGLIKCEENYLVVERMFNQIDKN